MSDPLCPPAKSPTLIQRPPPVVGQGTDTKCWAAAMESWLRARVGISGPQQGKFSDREMTRRFGSKRDLLDGYSWTRRSETVQELLDTYSEIISAGGGLVSGEALEQVAADNGMNWMYLDILSFNRDRLRPALSGNGHLYIAYFSYHMYHAVVAYGLSEEGLLAMNPAGSGGFVEIKYAFLREPGRVNRPIFVGWPESGTTLTVDHAVERYLIGEWHVLIGPGGTGWSGYFVFSPDNNVYWRTFDQMNKHWGKWKREGMAVTWQFDDDDPAWVRKFTIPINADNTIPDRIQSSATTQRGTVSFFTMTRTDD